MSRRRRRRIRHREVGRSTPPGHGAITRDAHTKHRCDRSLCHSISRNPLTKSPSLSSLPPKFRGQRLHRLCLPFPTAIRFKEPQELCVGLLLQPQSITLPNKILLSLSCCNYLRWQPKPSSRCGGIIYLRRCRTNTSVDD